MAELFGNYEGAIENTVKIAERCNVEFEFGKTILPNYDVPETFETHYDYIKKLCYDGIKKRYGENPSQVADRTQSRRHAHRCRGLCRRRHHFRLLSRLESFQARPDRSIALRVRGRGSELPGMLGILGILVPHW